MSKQKYRHHDFVFLSFEEHRKLVERFGSEATKEKIECLNDYIGSRGLQRKYKSHYYTILVWARKSNKPKAPEFNQPASNNGYYKAAQPTGKTINMKEAFTRLKEDLDKKKARVIKP